MHKFGREFSLAVMENRDGCVSERVRVHILWDVFTDRRILPHKVMKKLVIETPPPSLVDAYLGEIAKGYGIEWTALKGQGSDGGEGDDGLKVKLFPPSEYTSCI